MPCIEIVLFREYLEGLRETMEIFDEGGLSLGLDSKTGPPQYETCMLSFCHNG
jgi:hypothetical protein